MKYLYPYRLGLVTVLTCFWISSSMAQHNYELNNQGALITVQAGADLYVWGDVHMEGNTATLDHNGTLEVQGNLYSDNQFQQRGTGTVTIQNEDVNVSERQFISGNYAVRGGQSQIGVNDGSFYNLELANTQGVVHLIGNGSVADVRNNVNFLGGAGNIVNRIVTHDTTTLPANGSGYDAVFGMMNPAATLATFQNNCISVGGNMAGTDVGYVQGNLRRAISPAGGSYGFVEGLEPAGTNAARGMQYILLDIGPNNYDVISSYFEQGSSNTIGGGPTECNYTITYFGGTDHGEWMFSDLSGSGTGNYEVRIWPQDGNWMPQATYFITKDNSIQGTMMDCGATTTGLDRTGFNGFASPSEFNFAGGSVVLNANQIFAEASPVDNRYISVEWSNPEEDNLTAYAVERSSNQINFETVGQQAPTGNDQSLQRYEFEDLDVLPDVDYFYRIRYQDIDGGIGFSNVVRARLASAGLASEIKVYPIPVNGNGLHLQVTTPEEKQYTLHIYDGIGKLIHQQSIQAGSGISERIIETNSWSAGVYYMHLRCGSESLVKEILRHQ